MGTITIKMLFFIFLIHYLGDFILQTKWQAENKSKDNGALGMHVLTYSLTWFFASLIWYENLGIAFFFFLFTFIAHFITDYFTSGLTSKLFSEKDYHHGFAVVGFDQFLHYVQLIYTFIIMEKLLQNGIV